MNPSSTDRLISMANQIAANLAARGEQRAVSEMADHLVQFWAPSMRAAIVQVDPAQLSTIAKMAVQQLAGSRSRQGQ